MDDRGDARRSALPWPMRVRRPPGRWTLLASAALMLVVGALPVGAAILWL